MAVAPVIPFNAIPLLASVRPADRVALEPICRMRRYDKGEIIFHESEPAERIHFVVDGRVKIVKAVGTRDLILEILGPGEPVGAVAAFERRPFPATAVAIPPRCHSPSGCSKPGRSTTAAAVVRR